MLSNLILQLIIINLIKASFEIRDIPIENYEHAEAQNDEFDVELMPRSSRSSHLDVRPLSYIYERNKREVNEETTTVGKDLVQSLGQPLELSVIDDDVNGTEADSGATPDPREAGDFLINDFIRFRRRAGSDKVKPSSGDDDTKNTTRETRGATTKQWVKLPYQIDRNDELSYEDSFQSADTIRAPRVHFVTKNLEPEPKFNREGRSGSLNKDYQLPLRRDLSAEMDYYNPRYYERGPRRDDRYYQQPRSSRQYFPYDRPYDQPPVDRTNAYTTPLSKRHRRIIYYATLPELPRHSDPYDERYDYRDRYYEERRYNPYPDRYPYDRKYVGKNDGYVKPRYEERLVEKNQAYPVKVSTDLNVRDVKKNPERRVYSDVERESNNNNNNNRYNQAQNRM